MNLFKREPSPVETELRGQINYLREQVATKDLRIQELERHVIALTQPTAYTRIYSPAPIESDEILPQPILSPRRIPPFKLENDKLWEQTASRFEKQVEEFEKAMKQPHEDAQ